MRSAILLGLVMLAVGVGCGRGGRGPGGITGPGPGPGPGGGSGVTGTKPLTTLTPTEQMDLCEYIVMVQGGGPRSVECGDGVTIEVPGVSECVMESSMLPDCGIVVDQAEACAEAIGSNPCMAGPGANEACGPIIECALMGMGGEG